MLKNTFWLYLCPFINFNRYPGIHMNHLINSNLFIIKTNNLHFLLFRYLWYRIFHFIIDNNQHLSQFLLRFMVQHKINNLIFLHMRRYLLQLLNSFLLLFTPFLLSLCVHSFLYFSSFLLLFHASMRPCR